MTWDRYYKIIVPIGALGPFYRTRECAIDSEETGVLFSASLIFSNLAYLTLSIAFIQMCAVKDSSQAYLAG